VTFSQRARSHLPEAFNASTKQSQPCGMWTVERLTAGLEKT